MRRALLATLAIVGLYGCYDYTLDENEPVEPPTGEEPEKTKKARDDNPASPISPTSVESEPPPVTTPAPASTVAPATTDAGVDSGTSSGTSVAVCRENVTASGITCANGCTNNVCKPATKCVAGGVYCGGDKVNGEADVLYRCGSDGFTTTVAERCVRGCFVAPSGMDDKCN